MAASSNILVVDDEQTNFEIIQAVLSMQTYTLHYASNAERAIALLDNVKPDVILMDVMMPGMGGIEACRHIKARPEWQPIPIIIVTAMASSEDLARCLEVGADDFIGKPFQPLELCARVNSMLRIKQQHDKLQTLIQRQRGTINLLNKNLFPDRP